MNKLAIAFERFDAYNEQDPNTYTWEGRTYPQEYFLALKLHESVTSLDPQASEALLLASRCQHIGRWEIPRDRYPEGRNAYLAWRKALADFHANKASAILKEVGYDNELIEEVRKLILKKKIKLNSDVQTLENALCLVFLNYQFESFFPKYNAEKMVNILRKSLLKMDEKGRAEALKLEYSAQGLKYVQDALALIA